MLNKELKALRLYLLPFLIIENFRKGEGAKSTPLQ